MRKFANPTLSRAASRTAILVGLGFLAACGETPGGAGGTGTAGAIAGSGGQGGSSGGSAGTGGAGGKSAGAGGQSAGGSGQSGGAAGGMGMAGAAGIGGAGQAGADGGGQVHSDGGADAAGDAAAGLTLPIVRGDLDVLEVGPLSFSINPSKGARITSFKLDSDELLTDATANPQFFGSTLWTSPASDWVVPGTFVPPTIVDSDPYTTTVSADGVITATSGPSTANTKRFVITKVFHADLAKNAIVIDYKITNMGTAAFRLSHWEVTRVFPNGLMFFPSGAAPKVDFLMQLVQVTQAQGYTWYDNTTHMMGRGESKAGADSPGGFIAQVAPHTKGDLLFIKAFKAITTAAEPPGHYPIEFYCNDPHTYVEIEDHSSYDSIAPNMTYTQTVTWYLRRLPLGTARTAGSAALIAAALNTLGR
jgi:hypothetical protein